MLNRLYDMTLTGEYTVIARRSVFVGSSLIEIVSDPIKISVVEELPKQKPTTGPATAPATRAPAPDSGGKNAREEPKIEK